MASPIDVTAARQVLITIGARLDSVIFQPPEEQPRLKHEIAVQIDRLAVACGLVPADCVGKAKTDG